MAETSRTKESEAPDDQVEVKIEDNVEVVHPLSPPDPRSEQFSDSDLREKEMEKAEGKKGRTQSFPKSEKASSMKSHLQPVPYLQHPR